jgi:hypothetical protein
MHTRVQWTVIIIVEPHNAAELLHSCCRSFNIGLLPRAGEAPAGRVLAKVSGKAAQCCSLGKCIRVRWTLLAVLKLLEELNSIFIQVRKLCKGMKIPPKLPSLCMLRQVRLQHMPPLRVLGLQTDLRKG